MSNSESPDSAAGLEPILEVGALNKWWRPFLMMSWSFFVTYQIFIRLDQLYSSSPLCPFSDLYYDAWYWYSMYGCLGGFIMIWMALVWRILTTKTKAKKVPLYVAFNIVSMGTIATILALFDWGGMCIDVLNVASPAAIWGEWIACGPLLLFITVTVTDKPDLSRIDWFLMITFIACLVTGFFIIIPQSYAFGVFWLLVSCVTYIPVLYLPWYEDPNQFLDAPVEEKKMKIFADRFAAQQNLSLWLTIVLPLYTVNYLIAMFSGINAAQTNIIYQVLSVLTKGLFAAATMDIHADLLMETEKLLLEERRANAARRVFMKYIFHEVRTPLNSLTVGIDVLTLSDNLDEQEKECLVMMRSASEFMSGTLDDVLSMQKIEEGKLELELSPFSFKLCVEKIFSTFRGGALKKKLSLVSKISCDTPALVVGDVHRLMHVISNLLSNAIKFSPDSKSITIRITCDGRYKGPKPLGDGKSSNAVDIATLSVAVEDEGHGISAENQAMLFQNFVQIRPGALQQGQGSGLGLSFCKQIVELHKGTIGVTSQEGHGSKFHFTIPFEVASAAAADEDVLNRADDEFTPLLEAAPTPTRAAPVAAANLPPPPKAPAVSMSSTGSLATSAKAAVELSALPKAAPDASTVATEKPPLEVLVVDDADSNRKMLTMLLKRKKVKNAEADHGKAAVDLVMQDMDRFHMIMMDNLMPIMDGLEATRQLRARGFRYIIVGVTGNVMEDDIEGYINAGADIVCSKPLKMPTLDRLLLHVESNGPMSQPGMRLVDSPERNTLQWRPKQQ